MHLYIRVFTITLMYFFCFIDINLLNLVTRKMHTAALTHPPGVTQVVRLWAPWIVWFQKNCSTTINLRLWLLLHLSRPKTVTLYVIKRLQLIAVQVDSLGARQTRQQRRQLMHADDGVENVLRLPFTSTNLWSSLRSSSDCDLVV